MLHYSQAAHVTDNAMKQGIAPTIMVARVNLAAGEGDLWPRTRYSTGLRFRSQEGTENQSDTQVIGEENTEKQAVEYVSRGEP